jgi:hypothetical protein
VKPAFSKVLVFCPEGTSGGPEALHQLASQIDSNGGSAFMLYNSGNTYSFAEGVLRSHNPPTAAKAREVFGHYGTHPLEVAELPLDERAIVVYPEVWANGARYAHGANPRYHRAIWWLSVDNYAGSVENSNEAALRVQLLEDRGIIHFYQCQYAADFLRNNGVKRTYPLSDFTDRSIRYESQIPDRNISIELRDNTIAYFPSKGRERANLFFGKLNGVGSEINVRPIQHMTKRDVRAALFGTKIYIDFGHHPGKDRVPREAACAGAIILLRKAGAAMFFADHPIDDEYLFDDVELENGKLAEKVYEILANPQLHWDRQRYYRHRVLLEEDRFDLEVRTYFFE